MRIKNLIFILFFLYSFTNLFAQKSIIAIENRYYFDFKKGENVYLFGDKVNVRAAPSLGETILAILPVNTKIKVLEVLTEDTAGYLMLNGINAPWVKIQFGEKRQNGFIWAPLIAQYQISTPNCDYLFGIIKAEGLKGGEKVLGQLRMIKEGQVLTQRDLETIGSLRHYTHAKIYGNRGLEDVNHILELGFGYDACGYAYGAVSFAVVNDSIHFLGKAVNGSDSGLVYTFTDFIFPNDEGGRLGKIIKKVAKGDFDAIGNGTISTKVSVWEWSENKLKRAKH